MSARADEFLAACALVEQCLREGFNADWVPGPGQYTARAEAAKRWRKSNGEPITYRGFKDLLESAKQAGFEPDWSAYRPKVYLHNPPGAPQIVPQDHVADDDEDGEPTTYCVIGDAHDSPHIRDKSRFRWLGQFCEDHGLNHVIQMGDWFTMDCFSTHTDRATFEGLSKPTFAQDVDSFHESQRAFQAGLGGHKPKKDVTLGNHENRAWRYSNMHPDGLFYGELVEQAFAQWGWRTTPYGEFRFIDRVGFIHMPLNALGRPLTESQRPNKALFDIIHGDDHRATQRADYKIGPFRSPTIYSAGCALPPGFIDGYANKGGSTWRSGVCIATIWNGYVRSWSFTEMALLKRRYGRQGEDAARTQVGWRAA